MALSRNWEEVEEEENQDDSKNMVFQPAPKAVDIFDFPGAMWKTIPVWGQRIWKIWFQTDFIGDDVFLFFNPSRTCRVLTVKKTAKNDQADVEWRKTLADTMVQYNASTARSVNERIL